MDRASPFYLEACVFPALIWVKEVLCNDGKAFIIAWDLLKSVSLKQKERCRKP